MGLTIAQTIVRAHGGDVVLANRSPQGIEARVTLPVKAQSFPAPRRVKSEEHQSHPRNAATAIEKPTPCRTRQP